MKTGHLPLPLRVGKAAMSMAALVVCAYTSVITSVMADGGREGVWEFGCSRNSWLSAAAIKEGLSAFRINLINNMDLYRSST